MRLASLRDGGRDGALVVVSADHTRALRAPILTLQAALDDWAAAEPLLIDAAGQLEAGAGDAISPEALHAPLPRAYQYCEASAYLSHMERCRAARGAALPPGHGTDAAVLVGASDRFLAPTEPIVLADVAWDLDVEATVAVIVDEVPQGTTEADAASHIRLIVLVNDLTLRSLLAAEFAKGIGFFQSKPWRPLAPFALTPDELGPRWDGRLLRAGLRTWIRGELIGDLDTAADAAFDFAQIIAHASATRGLGAGTVVGSGTVSNRDQRRGFGCLAEVRALEILQGGEPRTPYLVPGDTIHIEAFDDAGRSLFGAMRTVVVAPEGAAS